MNFFLTYNKNKPYTTLNYAKTTAFRTERGQFYTTSKN